MGGFKRGTAPGYCRDCIGQLAAAGTGKGYRFKRLCAARQDDVRRCTQDRETPLVASDVPAQSVAHVSEDNLSVGQIADLVGVVAGRNELKLITDANLGARIGVSCLPWFILPVACDRKDLEAYLVSRAVRRSDILREVAINPVLDICSIGIHFDRLGHIKDTILPHEDIGVERSDHVASVRPVGPDRK